MSFSFKAKNEVSLQPLQKECCQIVELSAFIQTAGQIERAGDGFLVRITTEIKALADRIEKIIKNIFKATVQAEIIEDNNFSKATRYGIVLNGELATEILSKCHLLKDRWDGAVETMKGISRHLITDDCDMRSFIRGAFLGCASANIKIDEIDSVRKHRGGYHLEFVFLNEGLAKDFVHLSSNFEIVLKITKRKNAFVCYIKEMEMISDVLALVGANNAVLSLQNELAIRQVRNNLNRQLNCFSGNVSKTVDASMKQLDAIEKINNTIGIEALPDHLQDLCVLRLANPEETLDELVKLTNPPLTKSGVNHRFRKIVEIASQIKVLNKD